MISNNSTINTRTGYSEIFRFIVLALAPLVYLLCAASLAAFVTYPLYFLLDGSVPFAKLGNKTAQVLMLLGIYPAMRWQGLSFSALGLLPLRRFLPQVGKGFLYGLLILAVNLVLLLVLQVRVPDIGPFSAVGVFTALGKALLVGVLVALIEESLFRGLLLGSLLKRVGHGFAIAVSAFYYAGLHFMRSGTDIPAHEIVWSSGFRVMADTFSHLFTPGALPFDSFLALFAVGIFLATVRATVRTSLGYCMGLHASWVFLIKVTKYFSDLNPLSPWVGMVGPYDGIIGYPTALLLALLTGGHWWAVRGSQSPERSKDFK